MKVFIKKILWLGIILYILSPVGVSAQTPINAQWSIESERDFAYKVQYSESGGRNDSPIWIFEKTTEGTGVSFNCVIPAYKLTEDVYNFSFYYKASGVTDYNNATCSIDYGDKSIQKYFSNKAYWVKVSVTLDSYVAGEDVLFDINLGDAGNKIQISNIELVGSDGVNRYNDKSSMKADWHGWDLMEEDFRGSVYYDGGGCDGTSPYITIEKTSETSDFKSMTQTVPVSQLESGGVYTVSYDYFGNNLDIDKWGNVEHTNQSWIQEPTYLHNTSEWKHIDKDITLTNKYDLNVMFRMRSKGAAFSIANLKLTKKGESQNLLFNSSFLPYGFEKVPQMSCYSYEDGYLMWKRPEHITHYYNIVVYGDGELVGKYNSFEEKAVIGENYKKIIVYTEDVFGNKSEEKSIIINDENEDNKPLFIKSSDAYTFSFKGSEFVLLDVTESNSSKFFVMSKASCKKRSFDDDHTQKFDVTDSNNLAYYLNNILPDENVLPAEVLDAIDYSHVWYTEAGPKESNCPEAYSTTAGIAVLSETEYLKYKEKIGLVDDFYRKVSAWWLRTADSDVRYMRVLRTGNTYYDNIMRWDSDEWCDVRPVFYLDRDFFIDNEMDYCGVGVKQILSQEYEPHEIGNVSQSNNAFLVNHEFLNNGKKIVQGQDRMASDLYLAVQGSDTDEDVSLFVAYYDENDRLCDVEKSDYTIYANCSNYLVHKGSNANWSDISGFLWTKDMKPLSDKIIRNDYMARVAVSECTMGNIYTDDKDVQFNISATKGEMIEYSVTDFWGDEVLNGEFKAEGNSFKWTLPEKMYGHFTISFKYKGQAESESAKEIFCVVEEKDFTDEETSFFGVNAHMNLPQYGWTPEIIDLMAIMGVKSIRTDISWGSVETEKGVYKIPNTEYLDYLRKYNMSLNFTSGFNNSLYDRGMVPYTEAAAKAFANYQLAVLTGLKGIVTELDVYNEFYGGFGYLHGGGPARSQSKYYYQLLKESYDLIKPIYPDVEILATATTGSGYCGEANWYENLLKLGAAKKADGIYPHQYYTSEIPETALREQAEFYKTKNIENNAENLKMYITEFGASNYTGGVSEAEAAKYVVRANVLWMNEGACKAYWYDFMDDGSTISDKEQNFGLVYSYKNSKGAYSPKPAYVAYAVLTRQLAGYEFENLEYIPGSISDEEKPMGIYIGHFGKNGEKLDIIWSLGEYNMTVNTEYGIVTDIMGGKEYVNGEVVLAVNDEPLYLKGNYDILLTEEK